MLQNLPNSLRFELAPHLRCRSGRRIEVAQLHDLLCGEPYRKRRGPQKRAFLLCGLSVQVASRLLADLDLNPALPAAKRWTRRLVPGNFRVSARSMAWAESGPLAIHPLPATRSFVHSLPESLVWSALEWAPPVVTPPDRAGHRRVLANHTTALIARLLLADQTVWARVLAKRTAHQRTLAEMCQAIDYVMRPLFDANRRRTAIAAGKLPDAQLLSGYSRAWSARLVQRAS